jgi:hypothetical protein
MLSPRTVTVVPREVVVVSDERPSLAAAVARAAAGRAPGDGCVCVCACGCGGAGGCAVVAAGCPAAAPAEGGDAEEEGSIGARQTGQVLARENQGTQQLS